ncbi:Golgi-associated RAB2 interactor protein 5B [Heteronotia binoei]|uniref:Golgi-associated RAB2 interactor protein 5B n=1 Tax=Heteronotia binoei TaxID=13085 RepID=UPI002930018E|nr:Golgi-associated RAB2 interactor protein 5B [Heteronotia binoei]
MITYPPGNIRRGQHIFPECVSEHAFGGWLPTKGELHKLLQRGEYNLIGDAPIFEGTFVQVTKRGEFIGILNHPNIVILGILASTPTMLLPDLMIIARDKKEGNSKSRKLEIARLIPLELVEIYVHNLKERRLKIHMATGRNYYLQLCAPDGEEGFQFERWMRLIYLLHVAAGKAKPPSNVPSQDAGLHTIWKTASMPSETQHWLPVIMDKGSLEELKKWSSHASSTKTEQKSKQSAIASKQSPPKSGALQPSSQQLSGTAQPQAHTSREQPQDSVSKDLSKLKSGSATKQSEQQMGSQLRRFSTCKPCAHSPPPSHYSVAVETSGYDTMSVGTGPSVPFTVSEAIGPSQPDSQLSPLASSQKRSIEQPSATAEHEAVMAKASIITERESWASGEVPIKLERSKKSRSLVETTMSQDNQQKTSQSRSNALSLTEKSATKAQVTSQGSSRSARPLNQGEGGGLTSQRTSRKQSQMASRTASTRAPSANVVARSRKSEAAGSSFAFTKSVAAGPSEVGAVSVAAGPSQPASKTSRVATTRSKASQTLPFPVLQTVSHESKVTPAKSKVSDNASARILETVNAEAKGDMRSRPISREMSVKSKPSGKQGTSAAPSRLQSPGRTSVPYSQMAGMDEVPGTRPISREMSVKSKPSGKQGTSAAPSRLQSPGRTRAPYSQVGGMETQKLSKTKSSKPSPSQEPSPLGRTKKGWSQFGRKFVSVGAGPSEPGLKSVAAGTSQPFTGGQSRPQSRSPDASKPVKVKTIFSRKKSKSGDKTQPSSATQKQQPVRYVGKISCPGKNDLNSLE